MKWDTTIEEADKSIIKFLDYGKISIENAAIIWKNFEGRPNQFGNASKNFTLVLPLNYVEEFINRGFNVKSKDIDGQTVLDENGNEISLTAYFINIKVNIKEDPMEEAQYPTNITLFTDYKGKKTKRMLNYNTVRELDSIPFQRADVIINSYHSKQKGKENLVTGYLNTLYVIQGVSETDFGGAYDDWNSQQQTPLTPSKDDNGNVY